MNKLAVVISHPIQYYSPLFERLDKYCDLKVFYTIGAGFNKTYDQGFQMDILWDLPILEGYKYLFLKNTAKAPNSNNFFGIRNPDLINQLTDFNPSAILVYGWAYYSHLKTIRYFKGKIPLWFRGDSTLLDPQNFVKNSLRYLLLGWVYSHVDKAFYVGKANKAYFKKYGLKDNQLIFAPHAVDNDRFEENRSAEAKKLRKDFGILDQDILILFAGKFEKKKDPLLLLDAFIQIQKPNVHLVFVGNGELESSLKSRVVSQKHKRVHFMDFQNQTQMPVVYQACDLFCLPSKGPSETWGLAVNEAMAAGKAILVSDKVGCANDLVINNQNGFIFKAMDINCLITILEKCTSNPHLLKKLGKSSSSILKEWSLENVTEAIVENLI